MSASVKAPVTPSVLKWARETINYKIEEIVEKLSQKRVTISTIKEWESGSSEPTYAQLKKLAGWYKRPISLFFFPEPPSEEPFDAKFRSSLPEDYVAVVPPRIRFLVREATVRQWDLAEVYGDNTPEEYQKFKSEIIKEFRHEIEEGNSHAIASHIRRYLRVPLKEQLQWNTIDEALKRWRNAVESIGVWVFKEAFKEGGYSGFSLWNEKFPVIYLNNSVSKRRQIFTLFHELGHLLKHKGGIAFRKDVSDDFQGQYRKDEVFCNAFAGALLIPDEMLPGPYTPRPDDAEIEGVGDKYKVSREVILRKWREANLISRDYYREKVASWYWEYIRKTEVKQESNKGGGGDYYSTKATYLGDKYLTKMFRQYYDHRISEVRLADYLGVRVSSLEGLEERMFTKVTTSNE